MNVFQKYLPFFISAALMVLVLLIIYPHYQYYIDPDGIAYLTISRRYAARDWAGAINGYWSPWACWLTAMLINTGLDAIPASVIVNACGAAGCLFITQSFFRRFDIVRNLQWILGMTLGLFMCFAIFWQSFDDLWECFFLLSTLRIMLSDGFLYKPWLWVGIGLIGSLAHFAKAYSFPFFILNTVCCLYLISDGDKKQWLKASGIAIAVMIIGVLPWVFILHGKYGSWTTSTAGPLNTSWYLVGHPYYKPEFKTFLPPAYPDSPYFWEDPYLVNGDTPHFWSSWYLFGRQLLKIVQNSWKLLVSMLQLSVLFPLSALIAGLFMFAPRLKEQFSKDATVIALSFLLFPLGYILINFESRYIWYMLPLGVLLGALILQQATTNIKLYALCAITFLLFPVWSMIDLYDKGKQEYTWAQELKLRNIKGSFTTVIPPGKLIQSAARLAYFSGNSYYYIKPTQISAADLHTAMKQYGVQYLYVYTYAGNTDLNKPIKLSEIGKRLTEINIGETNELKVFKIN